MNTKFSQSCIILLTCLCMIMGCKQEEDLRAPYTGPIDPSTQISQLSKGLIITGQNKSGDAPVSNVSSGIEISIYPETASITNDNTLFIPYVFIATNKVVGMYLFLEGADNYWDIPINVENSNSYVLSVGIPYNILNGSFDIYYQIYDDQGNIGETVTLNTSIVSAENACGSGTGFSRVEGEDGITVRTYDLGNIAGDATISYYMYTLKDRMDIRYGGEWIKSTGELLSSNAPPIKRCDEVGNGDGFVSGYGSFTFSYDPNVSRKLDVYVSGCLDAGTLWYFDVECPGGSVPIVNNWYDALPDCPCTYEEAQGLVTDGVNLGSWLDCGNADQEFHVGSTSEVRWEPGQNRAAGQQCTYDESGNLITGGIAAGSPDRISPRSCADASAAWNLINIGYHVIEDVRPWSRLPCIEYLTGWPANRGNACGSNSNVIAGINHMLQLVGNMTCEEVTELINLVNGAEGLSDASRKFINGESTFPPSSLKSDLEQLTIQLGCSASPETMGCSVLLQAIANL